jgi:hypothetical protein
MWRDNRKASKQGTGAMKRGGGQVEWGTEAMGRRAEQRRMGGQNSNGVCGWGVVRGGLLLAVYLGSFVALHPGSVHH